MLLTVKKVQKINPNTFSLIFKKPANFNFYPGQYLDIENNKSFTLSSSPTEEDLVITTKGGISDFKKKFLSLKPGHTVSSSHPAGTFILDETEPAVFLAGGIGITPFRSMIKYAVDENLNLPISLIYSNSNPDFIFKDELELWQKKLHNLKISYINTSQDGRLTSDKLKGFPHSTFYIVHCTFYLAGSPGFVQDLKKILISLGVDEINIRADEFEGY